MTIRMAGTTTSHEFCERFRPTALDTLNAAGACGSPIASDANALPGVAVGTTATRRNGVVTDRACRCLVISPWAKRNYLDSTLTDQTSIVRFIEDVFLSGERIGGGSFDSIAGTLSNMFDFSQSMPQNSDVVLLDDTTGEVASAK